MKIENIPIRGLAIVFILGLFIAIVSSFTTPADQSSTNINSKGTPIYFIKKIAEKTGSYTVDIDAALIFSGEDAIEIASKETGCSKQQLMDGDCAPSLNNDFYISNPDKTTQTLSISSNVKVSLLQDTDHGMDLKETTFENFKNMFAADGFTKDTPYTLVIHRGIISDMEQYYLP